MPWPFAKIEQPRRSSALAATLGLPPETPDNLVRMYAGALSANNQAHTIKSNYDENNPPTEAPQAGAKLADR